MNTSEVGFASVSKKISELGAKNIEIVRKGNKRTIEFIGKNGNPYQITSRAKNNGTWQTSISYGAPQESIINESEFWVFVDISTTEHTFYVVPLWWIKNDIHQVHTEYLVKHGSHRAKNNNSNHNAISKQRIENWCNAWELIGLA